MSTEETLKTLLAPFRRYYDIKTEDVAPPFAAEAVFRTHDEQYFLSKKVRLAEEEANEYVFFAVETSMALEDITRLADAAWEEGLSRVRPHKNHRSSDIILVAAAEHIPPEAKEYICSVEHYRSYSFTLRGWSHFRLIALETSNRELIYNKQGKSLKKVFRNIK